MSLPVRPSSAPWIVGRPALLEHAAEDFLNEVTRQTPWRRARFEALLDSLDRFLGAPAPLSALSTQRLAEWRASLAQEQAPDAEALLAAFQTHLREWHWLE